MPNIAKILKDEIQRLARREVNQSIASLKQSNTTLKKTVTELKQRIAALEREQKRLVKLQEKAEAAAVSAQGNEKEQAPDIRITGKQIKSLRSRLAVTQTEMGTLVGVTMATVTLWEKKTGQIRIRKPSVAAAIIELKGMKKTEVADRLGKQIPGSGKAVRSTVTGPQVKSLRRKLGIAQSGLAKLLGVSNQIISVWEKKTGPLTFRGDTARSIAAVLKMTREQAQKKLENS